MRKRHYISYANAKENYGINSDSLAAMKSNKIHPEWVFKRDGKIAYVDINYFKKRVAFRDKIQKKAQDLCLLLEEHFSTLEMARVIERHSDVSKSTIAQYFNDDLFRTNESLTNVGISKVIFAMYRYWWKVERRLKRRGASIEKILDKRMRECYE